MAAKSKSDQRTRLPADKGQRELKLDELDNVVGGAGTTDAVVQSDKIGPQAVQHKHIAGVKYE